MPYQIFHIFTNSVSHDSKSSYLVKNKFVEWALQKLNLIEQVRHEDNELSFSHSIVAPSRIQEVIQDQITNLRRTKLEPLCIFIGSRDYANLCDYADLSLIQRFSYVESLRILEKYQHAAPVDSLDSSTNDKVFELLIHQSQDLINQKFQRIPGSLIVSGYRFLDLPLIILPWLSGVFVAPDMANGVEPNTTII